MSGPDVFTYGSVALTILMGGPAIIMLIVTIRSKRK